MDTTLRVDAGFAIGRVRWPDPLSSAVLHRLSAMSYARGPSRSLRFIVVPPLPFLTAFSPLKELPMRKLILLALAGFVWKKIQAKTSRPRIITDLSSTPRV